MPNNNPDFQNINDRKWTILKFFKRLLNKNSSVFDRQFLFNSLWFMKKLLEIGRSNYAQIKFSQEDIAYIKKIIQDDLVLDTKEKSRIKKLLNNIPDISSKKWDKIFLNNLQKEINKIDFKSENSYYKRIETILSKKINKYINRPEQSDDFITIKKSIALYLSTRIDLRFSIVLMEDFIKREEKYLKKEKEEIKFLNTFFEKFKAKNLIRTETYSIFVPLQISKRYFKELAKINIKDNLKIVRYSYPESLMDSPINKHTKNFDKDNLYLALENLKGHDRETLANEKLWEKVMNYVAIFKMNSIEININFLKPIIILKILKNGKSKVDEFNYMLNHSRETDTLFPITTSKMLIKQLALGVFAEKTSKFTSFLRSKSQFESSINPIERINLASRSLELYAKYPHKKGYGDKKTKLEEVKILSKKAKRQLVFNHRVNLILRNYSDLNRLFEKEKIQEQKDSSKKSFLIKGLIKELDNMNINEYKVSHWSRSVIKEIQGIAKLPQSVQWDFAQFLYFASLFIHLERNKQLHNKARYNLKDVLLSEIVDAMLSSLVQMDSYQKSKNNY